MKTMQQFLMTHLWLTALIVIAGCGRDETPSPSQTNAPPPSSQSSSHQLPSPTIKGDPKTNSVIQAGNTAAEVKRVFRGDEVLVIVDGVEVRVHDVIPISSSHQAAMSIASMQRFLEDYLNQLAILRAAEQQQLTLTASDLERVKGVESRLVPAELLSDEARANRAAALVYEERKMKADIYANQMLAARGVPSPWRAITKEEIEAYYRVNADKFPTVPAGEGASGATMRQIHGTIRDTLKAENMAQFKLVKADLGTELRTKSPIVVRHASDWAGTAK